VDPGPRVRGEACADLLAKERALPQAEQLVPAHDKALLSALGSCERALLDRGGKKLREATGVALPIYSLAEDTLAGLPGAEVYSYVALLNRFALIGDLRRQLHYGPRLRAWFDRIANDKACTDLTREAVLYFAATPESLGGSGARAASLTQRCASR
jgi:hypothetical protein